MSSGGLRRLEHDRPLEYDVVGHQLMDPLLAEPHLTQDIDRVFAERGRRLSIERDGA
jgi:hypothetical protein